MAKIGVLVTSNRHLDQLINFTKAAESLGHSVSIFFTHKGVLLTQESRFPELTGKAEMSLCNVGYESNYLKGKPAPGIPPSGFATQARNGAMIEDCDRYIVL
jgi:hypothetical protein